jgi:hypothetical protein
VIRRAVTLLLGIYAMIFEQVLRIGARYAVRKVLG